MAEKWADYLVSKVQYNAADTHIVKVMSHVDNGDTVGTGSEATRETVINRLGNGSTFMSITKGSDGKWNRGAPIKTVTIGGTKYIKTVADDTKKDNLGSLPRF
jgi:hypothetical protein